MATKDELLAEAKSKGLDVNTRSTKAEIESALNSSSTSSSSETPAETQNVDTVQVNPNENQEAVNGTTKDGQESPVENTESVPQNGTDSVETTPAPNAVAEKADEDRTQEEIQFADESNPNQKARVSATDGAEYDQDGNPRTGGKSYGVADDDLSGGVQVNEGEEPEEATETFTGFATSEPYSPGDFLNPEAGSDTDTNSKEWSVEDQQALEESLSEPENNIRARVITSAANYVKVDFFRNNLPLASYTSREFDEGKAKEFLSKVKEERGL